MNKLKYKYNVTLSTLYIKNISCTNKMTDKLFLKWNDFHENIVSSLGILREDAAFADVTLVCEDGQQMGANKTILASSSPFFQNLFQRSRHPHPMIYMRGMKSEDLVSILDFLYSGEAKLYQENLNTFLTIAEEFQLKGLESNYKENHEKRANQIYEEPEAEKTHSALEEMVNEVLPMKSNSNVPSIVDWIDLDEKVKSMMEKGENMLPTGRTQTSYKCKLCGKQGQGNDIRKHIEANHLRGVSIPCNYCEETFNSRRAFVQHKKIHQ